MRSGARECNLESHPIVQDMLNVIDSTCTEGTKMNTFQPAGQPGEGPALEKGNALLCKTSTSSAGGSARLAKATSTFYLSTIFILRVCLLISAYHDGQLSALKTPHDLVYGPNQFGLDTPKCAYPSLSDPVFTCLSFMRSNGV
ncbi:hypothetical protein CEXT_389991 [Caerostris extrusa]|uniref:Uncharacterized protein n=1 Tax=Caerostris extrusa TaxID=172846 RepID=A0AAV4WZ54_CAEEX|nr:hypothetical protein CEXT_389991 [Caerostris extrusa]